MSKRQQMKRRWVRVLAVALAVLLVAGTIASVVISMAQAEEAGSGRDSVALELEYLEEEQALHLTQRLVYHNRTGAALDRVLFCAAGNMFRRESALCYENDVLTEVFFEGYAPGGFELQRVSVNGSDADYGFQGENEEALRVACSLAPGESCAFEFEAVLLLTRCAAMLGVGDTDVRLSGFFFAPGVWENGDWVVNAPNSFTRWLNTTGADYRVSLTLPDGWNASGTGAQTRTPSEDGHTCWLFEAEDARDFVCSFGRRWRESARETASGVRLRALTNVRFSAEKALGAAEQALALYEEWFGAFPLAEMEFVQTDEPVCLLNFPGVVWIPEAVWRDGDALAQAVRFALAQQYLGIRAWIEPVADAWLSDAPCTYLALMAAERLEGEAAFAKRLNATVLDSLHITVPGGVYVSQPADLLTREQYDLVTIGRGTVVMHEMRLAAGDEAFLDAMRRFYEMGSDGETLTEPDLPKAFDEATGGDWEAFITDWLFNVDDYIDQQIDWYE